MPRLARLFGALPHARVCAPEGYERFRSVPKPRTTYLCKSIKTGFLSKNFAKLMRSELVCCVLDRDDEHSQKPKREQYRMEEGAPRATSKTQLRRGTSVRDHRATSTPVHRGIDGRPLARGTPAGSVIMRATLLLACAVAGETDKYN